MQSARSRFSHRHLLALGTFLVPLAIFGGFVWSELQRSGASAQAALLGASREFVKNAKIAIEQRIDERVRALLDQTQELLVANRPILTMRKLVDEPRFAALKGIILLDAQSYLVMPRRLPPSTNLPLLDDSPGGNETDHEVQMAEVASHAGEYATASAWLQQLQQKLDDAPPEYRTLLAERGVIARLGQAIVQRKLRNDAEARHQLEFVPPPRSPGSTSRFMAEYLRADIGTDDDRLAFLRSIVEDRHFQPDGLLTAIAHRLAATFPLEHPARTQVDELLRQEECRVAIREFAADFDGSIKYSPKLLRRQASERDDPGDLPKETERLVWSTRDHVDLVCIRPATPAEQEAFGAASVAVSLDGRALLGDVWEQYRNRDRQFVLAVHDMFDTAIVPPPPAPADFVVPMQTETTNDLTLTAYPADPAKLVAEAEASANQRTLAIVALFVMALGGALWSWRSVSRETELAAMKVDLVSRVSHELKTPLALVRMYGETLGMGRARDSAQVAEFGGIIARESERLTALIQRILDFSRQQAGTLSYTAEPIDLAELLREVVEAYGPHLLARGAVLIDTLPHGIRVHCDPNACESAIVNLLENAAKYGVASDDEHEIELVLEQRGELAVIEVRDRGRGIPPAELGRVFDGFYRASNAGEVRGAGLGLSLVRHFARAHGGDIEALPRDGGGTVMRLTLPIATSSAPSATKTPQPAAARPATDS